MLEQTQVNGDQPSVISEAKPNPFKVAQEQIHIAAEKINLDSGMEAILLQPERELHVHFPIRMDDGSIRVFDGFRVQIHSRPKHIVAQWPGLHQALPPRCEASARIIDAEVVADTPDGKHDFYELLRKRAQVTFRCFDLLSLRGRDLRELPLSGRRASLLTPRVPAAPPHARAG